ncbi:MAG: hypothetical protein RMY28_036095 [Nostoc sp. ChiSLP01]|nr:hypothetical protein [Nostoc sp. CmiSLP01]MDZ8282571.1 hypothetical protein [Nostoc sp. ChiSLP01]
MNFSWQITHKILNIVLPDSIQEESLGDLYEEHLKLKNLGKPKFLIILNTLRRLFELIIASYKLRVETKKEKILNSKPKYYSSTEQLPIEIMLNFISILLVGHSAILLMLRKLGQTVMHIFSHSTTEEDTLKQSH